MRWMLPCIAVAGALPSLAFAHPGLGSPESFATGVAHPFTGVDHVTAILAVGLWAALKGHRAVWAWSASFVGMMFIGGATGMAHVAVPYVDAGILASVIVMGLLVVFAVDLPVAAGAALIGAFAFLHGHAHGSEVPETANGVMYMAGLALATAALLGFGIEFALSARSILSGFPIRLAGGACIVVGVGLSCGVLA